VPKVMQHRYYFPHTCQILHFATTSTLLNTVYIGP